MKLTDETPIIETSFFKYLSTLSLIERAHHLRECGRKGGELYKELAEHFKEHHPTQLAFVIEKYLHEKIL